MISLWRQLKSHEKIKIDTITLYTPGHLEISWEVFVKKSADILSFRHSFTLSS